MNIKKICGYSHNGYLHEYGYKYEIDIYPIGRVWGSYYLYSTRPIDICNAVFQCMDHTICLDLYEWICGQSIVLLRGCALICKRGCALICKSRFAGWVPYFIFVDMPRFDSIIVYFTKLTL